MPQVIAQNLTGLNHLMYIDSTSSDGQASIQLTFLPGTDSYIAQLQVQNKL